MTPKDKAKELVWKFGKSINKLEMTYSQAKECALIAVEEIIKSQTCCDDFECKHEGSVILRWWGDVKREIELL